MATRAASFNYYYLIAACLLLALWVQWALARSRFGRAMRASAQSENAARALGINIVGIRTLAFAISAGFAGLGGGLFTNLALFVNYETFTFNASIELLLMTILGGSGTLAGPIVGTGLLFAASQALQGLQEWQTFGYGAAAGAGAVPDAAGHRRRRRGAAPAPLRTRRARKANRRLAELRPGLRGRGLRARRSRARRR